MAKDNHIIIEIPEAQLDFSSENWEEQLKNDFLEIQKTLESRPDFKSPAYYTWFWFFMKYGRALCSDQARKYLKSNNFKNVFELVKQVVGLDMSGGGAYTIGYKFFDECLKNNSSIDVGGIKIQIKDSQNIFSFPQAGKYSSYRPYITAIKSKPFLLLAGISGSGKSRIVRELARACWEEGSEEYKAQKPKNFEMVQVKPNWHDSSELIGYVSRIDGENFVVGPFLKFMVKAINDPETPYFLCLDEMNLAPVEQYFAEYLSVIESRKLHEDGSITTDPIIDYSNTDGYTSLINQLFPDSSTHQIQYLTERGGKRLSIPQNLIVVGTVNMDETTFSFSRKVLDRAMTIEMNEVNLNAGLDQRFEKIGKLGKEELIGDAVEAVDVYSKYKVVCETAIDYLGKINNELEGTPFKIAYRTRNEVLLYVVNNLPYNKKEGDDESTYKIEFVIARALDEITNMKILSRIEGDETKVSVEFLERLMNVIKTGLSSIEPTLFEGNEQSESYNSVSLAKLDEMKKRLQSGYTSFWN